MSVQAPPSDESSMLAKSCCQPGFTEVSINGSLMPEKDKNGEKGHTRPGEENHLLVNM